MYRTAITGVQPGAVLAMCVFNESGHPLVKAGVSLTERVLRNIASRGYCRLVLADPEEVVQPELVSPESRARVVAALEPAVDFLVESWRSKRGLKKFDGDHLDRALRYAVRDFVSSFLVDFRPDMLLALPGNVRRGHQQWLDDAINAAAVGIYLGCIFGFDDATLHRLAHGMLLRDVGMLVVPDEVRERPGPLPPDAWELVREHPVSAYQTLCELDWLDESARLIVLQHHERHDGSGYPYGITGLHTIDRSRQQKLDTKITLHVSEVAAIADVFNALTVDRPHRGTRSTQETRDTLLSMAGMSLNEEVVHILLNRWRPPVEESDAGPDVARLRAS